VTSIVGRLSIMLLRVFCADSSGGMMDQAEEDLVNCITDTALQNNPRFEWDDMELFHARCEVLVRLVGFTGRKSLARFYSRGQTVNASRAMHEVLIEFCQKPDGVIAPTDKRSIFGRFTDRPICSAVYMARSGQAGFDMVTFENKSGGGYVAIFVDTKYSAPEATTSLGSEEAGRKWAHCLTWRKDSEAAKILGIGPEDCFLVLASWRSGEPVAIQAREARDEDSHILVLGRAELTHFYTPTLVSRPHWIAGRALVQVEGDDGLSPHAEGRDPNP
jgi:hypothetical protein